ncbi:MAG: isopropylmalate isomerase [Pelagimonas sp.]|nr:isopropylmalate isomerase [Pelagimonas sp.]
MSRILNMGDRARLRERFYGAAHTVLARLRVHFA